MKETFKVAVTGYGRIGKIHVQNLLQHQGVGPIAICDPKKISPPSPDIQTFTVIDDLLDQFRPDILFICSPTPTHVPLTLECCERGIHVFCEKPIDLDLDKVKKLASDVTRSDIALHVGFNRRFDPDFAKLKRKMESGQVGEIYQIIITSRDPGLPSMDYIASSGGMILDMTIHDIDMALFLTTSTIKEVYCKGQVRVNSALREYDDIDTATTVLTFENQISCTIVNSRESVFGYDQRIEVFGSKGMISVDNQLIDKLSILSPEGRKLSPPEPFFLERYAASYKAEVDDFINRILQGEKPSVTLNDAIAAGEIASMVNESMRNQRIITP